MVCKPELIFDYFTLSNIWYSNKSNIKADSLEKNFYLTPKKGDVMNIKQKTLAALLVLGIGMSGCSNNDNNPISPTVDEKTDQTTENSRTVVTENNITTTVDKNKTTIVDKNVTITIEGNQTIVKEGNKTTIVDRNLTTESNVTIIVDKNGTKVTDGNDTIIVDKNGTKITDGNDTTVITNPSVENNNTEENRTATILGYIGSQHSNHNSTITVAQLREITPALSNIDDRYLNIYQRYIASADTTFSSPATRDEVQSMINEVNDFNLPEHAILDRSFFKKTNGAFEHRFVYLPVKNTTTGRTWLNNNLGASYADMNSSAYNPSQQATARNDYKAYGSLFQWGRKADGHELFDWTGATAGTAKHGKTSTKVDEPSDSLFITSNGNYSDWRATQDDTLWANESSANSVCPVGYRLPLDPNGADDGENELAVEINSWDSKDTDGSMSSDLKLPSAGFRWINSNRDYTANEGIYWSGSVVPSDGNNSTVSDARNIYFGNPGDVNLHDSTHRGAGSSVRCIKN